MYKVLGTTDDRTVCELCGRDDLKSTVALEDESGNVVYYGSDCAARASGWTVKDVRSAASEADKERRRLVLRARVKAGNDRVNEWQDWLAAKTGVREIGPACQQLGGFKAARELYNEEKAA